MPSLSTTSMAMREAGYQSYSIATHATSNTVASLFDERLDRDRLPRGLNSIAYSVRAAVSFARHLFRTDIVHIFFSGGLFGQTPLRDWEARLWKLAGIKIIIFPYGSDAFVYRQLPDTPWANAIIETYPRTKNQDENIEKRIKRMTKYADVVVGCIVHTVNLPRIDVWPVLWYPVGEMPDLPMAIPSQTIRIAHSSNHRAIKGSEYIIQSIKDLKAEGYDISLDLIEGVNIDVSRSRLAHADIIIDQLHMGYAMSAIEGMALGKPVLSGFNRDGMYRPFFSKSYLNEAPLIQTSAATLTADLRRLISDENLRDEIGKDGLKYVKKYHSNKATVKLFENIYAAISDNNIAGLELIYLSDASTEA